MATRSQWRVAMLVAGVWTMSLLYGELFAFWRPLFSCHWPVLEPNAMQAGDVSQDPIRIALIADPQITYTGSHGWSPRSTIWRMKGFYSDIYMRRAFRSTVLEMNPNRIFIMGEYFKEEKLLSKEEWVSTNSRFEHVFDQSERGVKKMSKFTPVHYLPASEYLWHGAEEIKIFKQYSNTFGMPEFVLPISSLEFLFTNAKVLDDLESHVQANTTWSYYEDKHLDKVSKSRVLLTPIPLYRPAEDPCGAHHVPGMNEENINQKLESLHGNISRKYLSQDASTKLLNTLRPVTVFSGQGNGKCSLNHRTAHGVIVEHTVGTFNWHQGNGYPSFLMISIAPDSSARISSSICHLPVPIWTYTWYAVMIAMSLVAVFSWPAQGVDFVGFASKASQYTREIFRADGGVKVKDEDAENGDWEMVWDAEGAMHLIRGQKTSASISLSIQGGDRRGTALARPAAKRQGGLELDSTITVEPNPTGSRPGRSRNRALSNRLWSTLGPLAVLAALNLSLYVMLLMKDWI